MNEHDHLDSVLTDIRNIFGDLKADMRIGFNQVNERLDAMNGRVRNNEQKIAVLQDRSDKSFAIAGLLGTLGAALIQGALFIWQKLIH